MIRNVPKPDRMRRFLLEVIFLACFFLFTQNIFAQSNQVLGNGGSSTPVIFTGSSCTYNWVNSNPSIGLAASGTGDIASFTAINNSGSPATATITATPVPAQNAYITNAGANTISVIDVTSHALIATIPVGQQPEWASVSPDGSRVYIANHSQDGSVSVINTLTNMVTATISVGPYPICIALNSDASLAYVSNSNFLSEGGSISVIDTKTNNVIHTFSLVYNPNDIALSKDGTKLYVVESNVVAIIDAATGNELKELSAGINATNAISIVISPDGKHIYVTSNGLDGYNAYVTVINTATATIEANIKTDNDNLFGINISPDGQTLYVTSSGANNNTNDIFVINTNTNTVSATIPDGVGDPYGVCFTPDGKQAYVINYSTSEILDINTADNTIITHIPLGAFSFPNCSGNFISPVLSCSGSPVSFTITVYPQGMTPTILGSTVTGAITSCAGTASASPSIQQFTISGSNLSAPVTANAPTGFEVSLTSGSGYGNSITLNQTAGSLNSTTVYVRSAAGDAAGQISGNVVISSTGAANQNVAVSGVVNALATVATVANQMVANGAPVTAVNFTGTGNSFTWINDTPSIGLAGSGTGNIPTFTAVNKGNGAITATITVMPLNNTGCNGTPIKFTITVNPTPLPTIVTALANLNPLATIYGTASSVEYFTISGTDISGGISVTPPAGFEVSSNSKTFNTTTTINGNGNISAAQVYIRLAATTPVGSYSGNIMLSANNAASVNIFMPASAVNPAPLTITADNVTKPFGAVNPPLTVTYAGFVNNDGPAQLTSQPLVTTTSLTQSAVGQYPITVGNAISPNYTFTYIPGILTIEPSLSALSIPNTFTPNGDGINDTWVIKYLNYYPKSTVNIFNRWGQKVFSSIGYPAPWDGNYEGTALPSGTYYYIIDPKNGQAVFSGWLAIIR